MKLVENNKSFLKNISHKHALLLGLFTAFSLIAFFLLKFDLNHNPYILGDWLINYEDGGFKRRGLSGSLFFLLQDLTGVSLVFLVFTAQLFFYLAFFISFYKLIYKKKMPSEFTVMIFTPMTLLFFLNDPYAIGRKEILIIALLSITALWHEKKIYSKYKLLLVITLLFIFTLMHEIIIFYIPYFIILHFLHLNSVESSLKLKIKIVLAYLIPVLIPTFLMFIFGTNLNNGKTFEILSQRGISIYGGVFTFNTDSYLYIKSNIKNYFLYIIPFIYGHLLIYRYVHFHNKKHLLLPIYSAWFFSAPIFFMALDWGRWLSIHFISTLLLIGSILNTNTENPEVSPGKKQINDKYIFPLILIFNFCFIMPNCDKGFKFGSFIFNLMQTAINRII